MCVQTACCIQRWCCPTAAGRIGGAGPSGGVGVVLPNGLRRSGPPAAPAWCLPWPCVLRCVLQLLLHLPSTRQLQLNAMWLLRTGAVVWS
jgi:hypothetical protein